MALQPCKATYGTGRNGPETEAITGRLMLYF